MILADLQALAALLDQVTEGAGRAHEATRRLNAEGVQPSMQSLQALQATMSVTAEKADQTTRHVATTLADLQYKAEQTQAHVTTRLDDLQNAVQDHSNLWNKAVSELIDAVKIGAVPIEKLIELYGDAKIGGERLVDYLKGLDFNVYQDKVNEMIRGLHEGSIEIGRVQEYLGQTQLLFAKQLSDIIDLFKKGSVTLKRVEEVVRDIRKAFPDSEFSDLAQALYDALRRGDA